MNFFIFLKLVIVNGLMEGAYEGSVKLWFLLMNTVQSAITKGFSKQFINFIRNVSEAHSKQVLFLFFLFFLFFFLTLIFFFSS